MNLKRVKIASLKPAGIDWAVGTAQGYTDMEFSHDLDHTGKPCLWWVFKSAEDGEPGYVDYEPHRNNDIMGPIVDECDIDVLVNDFASRTKEYRAKLGYAKKHPVTGRLWYATAYGDTRLIAAARCYLRCVYGDFVEIPEELA